MEWEASERLFCQTLISDDNTWFHGSWSITCWWKEWRFHAPVFRYFDFQNDPVSSWPRTWFVFFETITVSMVHPYSDELSELRWAVWAEIWTNLDRCQKLISSYKMESENLISSIFQLIWYRFCVIFALDFESSDNENNNNNNNTLWINIVHTLSLLPASMCDRKCMADRDCWSFCFREIQIFPGPQSILHELNFLDWEVSSPNFPDPSSD
jgi:hypothetical protein